MCGGTLTPTLNLTPTLTLTLNLTFTHTLPLTRCAVAHGARVRTKADAAWDAIAGAATAALASARLDAAAAPRLAEAIGLLQVCWLSRCQPLPTTPALTLAPAATALAAGEESVAVAAAFGTVLGVYCGAIELWLGSHAVVRAAQP